MCGGCASLVPLTSLLTTPSSSGTPPVHMNDQTDVKLAQDNFIVVRTNVVGRSRGFSLLGIITIVPATVTKAVNRMYDNAAMRPGTPQTFAHLMIERSTTYWILFGIPQIDARADVVEFKPEAIPDPNRGPPKPAEQRP
jgi:hypothetical protein